MMDIFEAGRKGYTHKNLIFWMGMMKSLVQPIKSTDKVLDLGCGFGLFLQLLFENQPYEKGIGIDLDLSVIVKAKELLEQKGNNWPIEYFQNDVFSLDEYEGSFDVIFCQEILWMNKDINQLAKLIYKLLKPNGCCYCTMGSHTGNPLWTFREQKLVNEGYEVHTRSTDEVAQVFSSEGFSVGMRRLPIDGFIMYHPIETPKNSKSFYDLVQTTNENKMLFYFGKNQKVGETKTLQG